MFIISRSNSLGCHRFYIFVHLVQVFYNNVKFLTRKSSILIGLMICDSIMYYHMGTAVQKCSNDGLPEYYLLVADNKNKMKRVRELKDLDMVFLNGKQYRHPSFLCSSFPLCIILPVTVHVKIPKWCMQEGEIEKFY